MVQTGHSERVTNMNSNDYILERNKTLKIEYYGDDDVGLIPHFHPQRPKAAEAAITTNDKYVRLAAL